MNSQIQQLKKQSYVTKDGEFCFDGGKVEILDVNKFAELLWKEAYHRGYVDGVAAVQTVRSTER